MKQRKVYRIPRPIDGIISNSVKTAAINAGCPEIELRDDINSPVIYIEKILEPLRITSKPILLAKVNQQWTYSPAYSGDVNSVTWQKYSGPKDIVIDADTGVLTWTPTNAGKYDIDLIAASGIQWTEQAFTIEVKA